MSLREDFVAYLKDGVTQAKIGGTLFLLGALFFLWSSFSLWLEHRSLTADLEPIPCRIEEVELLEETRHARQTYRVNHVRCRYSYEVDGQVYEGRRVSADEGFSRGTIHRRRYEELERHRREGRPFTAHVRLEEPTVSVLYPGKPGRVGGWLTVAGLFFGAGCLLFGIEFLRWRGLRPAEPIEDIT